MSFASQITLIVSKNASPRTPQSSSAQVHYGASSFSYSFSKAANNHLKRSQTITSAPGGKPKEATNSDAIYRFSNLSV
jgi:hypothetical protein